MQQNTCLLTLSAGSLAHSCCQQAARGPSLTPVVGAVLEEVQDRHGGVAKPAEQAGRAGTKRISAQPSSQSPSLHAGRRSTSPNSLGPRAHPDLEKTRPGSLVHQERLQLSLHIVEGPVGQRQALGHAALGHPAGGSQGGGGLARKLGRDEEGTARWLGREAGRWLGLQRHSTPPRCYMGIRRGIGARHCAASPGPDPLEVAIDEVWQEVEEGVDQQRPQVLPEEDGAVADLRLARGGPAWSWGAVGRAVTVAVSPPAAPTRV